jgi:hypothetical protein
LVEQILFDMKPLFIHYLSVSIIFIRPQKVGISSVTVELFHSTCN